MAEFAKRGPTGREVNYGLAPPKTPGSTGKNDAGDPNVRSGIGCTAGPVGVRDGADPNTHKGINAVNPQTTIARAQASRPRKAGLFEFTHDKEFARRVASILRTVPGGINYTLNGHTTSTEHLKGIAAYVENGWITVASVASIGAAAQGVKARYFEAEESFEIFGDLEGKYDRGVVRADTILIYGEIDSLEGRATVVHEAVHAHFDRQRVEATEEVWEMSAWIIMGWYIYLELNPPKKQSPMSPGGSASKSGGKAGASEQQRPKAYDSLDPQSKLAYDAAEAYAAGNNEEYQKRYRALRNSLAKDYDFSRMHKGDGIKKAPKEGA